MIKWLIKKFIPNHEAVEDIKVRERYGLLSGILGILCNAVLFALKLAIGLLMNSIAIISDAFNNLSDTASSVVAIISAKMSSQRPDEQHPFGHGRMEYIASLIVAFLIMLAGVELLKSSFDKTLHPEPVNFSLVPVVILALSVLVKVWMFSYNRYIAKKIGSEVARATSRDALNDVFSTSAVILSTVVGLFVPFPIDGIAGLIVSLLILYTGFGVMRDTVNLLLGKMPDSELVDRISACVLSGEEIVGVHDLIVHDYGPGRIMASVHAEVPDNADVIKIHEQIDEIEQRIQNELGIHIVIHMDPISTDNERVNQLKEQVQTMVKALDEDLSIHDFRITEGDSRVNIIFDLAVPVRIKEKEREQMLHEISEGLRSIDPRYTAVIQVDDLFV